MEDAIVPMARSFREIGIVANDIQRRLEDAVLPWLGILRHEEDVADAFAANFVNKLIEAGRVRQIGGRIGFDAMAVTATDKKLVPLLRDDLDLAILLPVAQTIQLHRVDELVAARQEFIDAHEMPLGPQFVQVPHRMVEHDQSVWQGMQLGEYFIEARRRRRGSKLRESMHPVCGSGAGQVMYAEMKNRIPVGDCPLNGDRGVLGGKN